MNLIDIKYKWLRLWWTYRDKYDNKRYLRKYLDYEVNEYNEGAYKFIWGVKSWDDLTGADACLHTMNDIDIVYDRDTKKYSLGVETAYMFEDKQGECKYLRQLLNAFTAYMDANNLNKNERYFLFFHNLEISLRAESIEELYTQFRIFVEGYCKVHEYEANLIEAEQ